MSIARGAALMALLGAAGCAELDAAPGPQPEAIVPAGAYQGQAVRVRVSGTGYAARGVQHLGGAREVAARFEVRIGGILLSDVHYLGESGESDVVDGIVPADLPAGVHDVEVRDPYGRTGVLRGAFTESGLAPPVLSALLTAPAQAEVGAPLVATAKIANSGGSDARISALDVDGVDASAAGMVVPAGGSISLEVVATVPVRGAVTLQLHATAVDRMTGIALPPLQATAPMVGLAPPSLVASLEPTPATVNVGQTFSASLIVSNQGDVDALAVVPALLPGTVFSTGSITPQDVPAGGSRTLVADVRGTAPALEAFDVVVTGTDQLTGAPVTSAAVRSAPIAVVNGASLSAGTPSLPAVLSRGQAFAISITIGNAGQATALAVQPALNAMRTGGADFTVLSAPGPREVAGGTSETFTWSCIESGTAAGSLSITVSASGTDANSGAVVSAASPPAAASVQQLAILSVSVSAPSAIDRGQAFTVSTLVTNTGGATARGVQVTLQTLATGGAAASLTSLPVSADLDPGSSATFSFGYKENGGSPGTLTFQASASGIDANSGGVVSGSGSSATMPVQTPASLSISSFVLSPAYIQRGQPFSAKLTVTNTGQAGAASVTAALFFIASGGAHATTSSSPGFVGLAGGGSATLTWTFTEDGVGPGSLAFSAMALGLDANSGASLVTSPSSGTVVVQPPESTLISSDPFAADGTNFAYLFSYQGMVYAGPNASGTGAVRMAPDGSNPTSISWALEVNTSLLSGARNLAYQLPFAPVCHTIGTPGCAAGTTACGPDNESGRAMFASGTINGTEWYLVTGASPTTGSRYLYMTNPSFPLAAGGYDDLAFVQIQAGQFNSTRMMTAAHIFQNKLYLGFLDNSGRVPASQQQAPVLNVLSTRPALPGYIAAAGTDLLNLQGLYLPAVGVQGLPASNNGQTWLMIDSITDLNGALYVANNGGIARSVGAPTPCSAGGCANWANATPSASAWSSKTSVVVDSTVLGTLQPAQRAVPGMVAFGGRLFAARNTTAGPQLWSCDPSKGSDPQQCEQGDWTLLAPNSSGDTLLSQFNSTANTAITLLAATSMHLYVGFNSTSGIQIFRTALPSASARSDFTGQLGCDASQPACPGIGGTGLGAALTRIFDGHVFTWSGAEWLYLAAGDGSSGPRVYRLAP